MKVASHRIVDIGARAEKGGVAFDLLIHPKYAFDIMAKKVNMEKGGRTQRGTDYNREFAGWGC